MEAMDPSRGQNAGAERRPDFVDVSVYTTSGAYPKKGSKKVKAQGLISEELDRAKHHLKLTDTSGWVVLVDGKKIDASRSFTANGLTGTVVIHWGPREGGGG